MYRLQKYVVNIDNSTLYTDNPTLHMSNVENSKLYNNKTTTNNITKPITYQKPT
jgi:hypothetical protein